MRYVFILALLGLGWGLTQPLTKMAVIGGYRDFGMIFWQSAIMIVILGAVAMIRGKGVALRAPRVKAYVMIALLGTVLPNAAGYTAYIHLDAGIMAVLISLVPIFSLPIALMLGTERLRLVRLFGLILGLGGVLLLMSPNSEALRGASVWWVAVGLIPSLLYATEGNVVARFGIGGQDPLQLLLGASVVALGVSGPLMLLNGSWINPLPPYGLPDLALVLSSAIHAFVYSGYVWLVSAAGAVFAVQVGYIVTLSGVLWSWVLLGETYAPILWLALAFVLLGVFLVQPKPRLRLAEGGRDGQD